MPDGDGGHDSLSSVQPSHHLEQPGTRRLHRPSPAAYHPLDRASTLTSTSNQSGSFLSALTHQSESSSSVSQVVYASDIRSQASQAPFPDPNEFYRSYTSDDAQKGSGIGSLLPSADAKPGMIASTTSVSHSPDLSDHFDSSSYVRKTSTSRSYQLRSTSGDSSVSFGDSALRPQPLGKFGTRNRQASFKDLVERFNKNVDDVPPVPTQSQSALSSRAASPSPNLNNRGRSRTHNTPEDSHHHVAQFSSTPFPSLSIDDSQEQFPPTVYQRPQYSSSQSFSPGSTSRRPLFGELLTLDTAVNNQPGHGILPSHPRRRGSESSVPSPHPLSIDNFRSRDSGRVVSPSSPTAWYLGYTQSLESINNSTPGGGGRSHRRSRSDASWATMKPIVASPLSSQMATTSSQEAESSTSPGGHNVSKSRIPIASSRRASRASDTSGSSSPSTRTSSAMDFHHNGSFSTSNQTPLAPKGSSRLPKPLVLTTANSEQKLPPPLTVKSPGRRNIVHSHGSPRQAPDKGSLKVYVSAPPPKLSPPLRSSRPRQPVSAATTAASRAKVVDRVSRLQTSQTADDDSRNSRTRTRKPPELGNVDFAARRQRIQQAFNKSVQESVKKEEEAAERRRLARYKRDEQVRSILIREGELRKMASMESALSTPVQPHANDVPQLTHTAPIDEQSSTSSPLATSDNQLATPTLSINTSSLDNNTQQSQVVPEVEATVADSPTLGIETTPNIHLAPSIDATLDVAPSSAVTTATNDTDSTNFDPEPQVGLDHQGSHRNLLSRIMQLRESSSSSECDEDEDGDVDDDDDDNEPCDAENDGKESIHIMLDPSRATFFLDGIERDDDNDLEVSKNAGSDTTGLNRWSMASWASSAREPQSSLDSQCDAEDALPRQSMDDDNQPLPNWNESTDGVNHTPDSFHDKPVTNTKSHERQNSDHLIRQGGWDSKRVTQLYLQELSRSRTGFNQSLNRPWGSFQPEEMIENQPRSNNARVEPDHIPNVEPSSPQDHILARASLILRTDWENASPSIADWMQVAATERTVPQMRSHPEFQISNNETRPADSVSELPVPVLPQTNESWNGLGLAINVQSSMDEARVSPMPPVPTYAPPPVPNGNETLEPFSYTTAPQSVSPSIYTSQPPSSNLSSDPFPSSEEYLAVHQNEGSYMAQANFSTSPPPLPPVVSFSTSQHQISTSDSVGETQAPVGSPTPEQKQLKQRRNVIKELIDTEYSYGRDMKVVDDIYKGTSSSCLDLSADDVKVLFANSDQIVQFSMNFQDSLKQAAKSVYVMPKSQRWSSKKGARNDRNKSPSETVNSVSDLSTFEQDQMTFIGHVFIENMSHMEKVYTEYLKNHEAANKKLQVLQRNPKVEIWLKECRDWAVDLTEAWNLDALLVKPVQRLVKYPLLLTQLINATPESHPDHVALVQALEGVTKISVRINDLKKRADVVSQVVSNRKRKDSDVRSGFSKAFGRRTEKLRQQVGLSEMFEDTDYNKLANRFNEHFFQLQVVMRDVEMYTREIKSSMDSFNDYVTAIQGCIDVAQSNYTEIESKWHRLRVFVREIMSVALPEHIASVRKGVIDPMLTLLKLYEGPQKVMAKRDKRLLDYARYKSVKDRGDKLDKRTTEQGEQFSVLNDALKDELPRLFSLTAKLMEACLRKFVFIQQQWYEVIQQKLGPIIDRYPGDIGNIVSDWSADFSFADMQIMSLGLCNGALLSEAGSLLNFNAPVMDGTSSPRRPSTVTSSSARTTSGTFDSSPKVSYDLGTTRTSFQSYGIDGQIEYPSNSSQSFVTAAGRTRANSAISGVLRSGMSIEQPVNGQGSNGSIASVLSSARPRTGSTSRQTESSQTAPQLSLDMPFMQDPLLQDTNGLSNIAVESTASPTRFSGFFSSAMPMSDSPKQEAPLTTAAPVTNENPNANPKVLFLAASLYEFNIDKSRREAGYPYLTYTEGEVFDVIGEKGELWLAKNQDDPTGQVGWIWTQHFAKLSG